MRTLFVAVAPAFAAAAPASRANGRISWVMEIDGKQQARVGPLDLRPSRRTA